MTYAALPSTFNNMKNVTVGLVSTAVAVETTLGDLDNVVHCNHA